ncbi:uncharacterized protein LOC113634507 [Tachysurus fulvidraco]|uniref:uncharacterized protein LOC113634507 n=1 Tax=Tachysurus fulvidraco TaxID=1234273 RepID=UPI001FEEAA92|nr:uncharacterized protein LOC113634507 [Tachysurus fulvidraco]
MLKIVDWDKKPPPNKSILDRIIKAGGRRLPGMVPSSPISYSEQLSGGEELSVQDDNGDFMEWWYSEEPWKELDHPNAEQVDAKSLKEKAENLIKALHVYDYLLCKQEVILQGHIKELEEVVENIDKEVKTADRTRGTLGAIGLTAAVGAVIYAPTTRVASLAVATIGFGVTAFWAVISKKRPTNVNRKKLKTILNVCSTQMEEIERCLKYISLNMACLNKHDLSASIGVDSKAEKVVRMVNDRDGGNSIRVISAVSKCSGLIQGFVLGMDTCFCKDDNEKLKKLKRGSETKFSTQISVLIKQVQVSLDQLISVESVLISDQKSQW